MQANKLQFRKPWIRGITRVSPLVQCFIGARYQTFATVSIGHLATVVAHNFWTHDKWDD